jgi:hypothetical protein
LLDSGAIVRRGVVAHGFGIGEDLGQGGNVFGIELAEEEARGLEDGHL